MFVEWKIDNVFKIKKEVFNTTNIDLTNEDATESHNDCVQQEIQMEEEQGNNELTEINNSEGKYVSLI